MKILVIGKNGQLGKSINKIVSNSLTSDEYSFIGRDVLDLANLNSISDYFEKNQFEIVVNCAAFTKVDNAEDEKKIANLINHLAIKKISSILKFTNSKLIHISTDYVFDGISKKPFTEKDITCPINYYGKSKLSGELALLRNMPSNAIVIRTSWMYSEFENNFLNTMLNLGKVKNELKVVNDEIGSPTYALDLAQAIVKIIESRMTDELFKESQIYHFASLGQCSWFEFANEIFKKTNINCRVLPIKSDDYVTIAKRPKYSVLDTTKISKDYDVNPKNWTESLYICINEINKTHV